MPYALPFVGIDAGKFQDFTAFGTFTFLLGTVNPNAVDTQRMGGEHKISHYQATVVDTVAPSGLGKHHDDDRRTVEGVARSTEDFGVHPADAVTHFPVGHHKHFRMLVAHSVGSILSALHDLLYLFF